MTDDPIHWRTLGQLAADLRSGAFDAAELATHFLNRIEALDPTLGAFRVVDRESTLRQARAAAERLARGEGGPLCGVPYAVKDLFDVEGLTTGAGTRLLEAGPVATRSAAVIERLDAAGMVLLGKTHTVQLAYGGVGINNDVGTPPQPLAAGGVRGRRLQQWVGGCGRGRHGADRARHRHRRLGQDPRVTLRTGGSQDDGWDASAERAFIRSAGVSTRLVHSRARRWTRRSCAMRSRGPTTVTPSTWCRPATNVFDELAGETPGKSASLEGTRLGRRRDRLLRRCRS